jgi:peptide-methionine (S)-S-oxide reductase
MRRAVLPIVFALAALLATSAAVAADPARSTERPLAKAIFAGGCFWCMEPPFDKLEGVIATISGYTGGPVENPSYEQVSSGRTGHVEAVLVEYDPASVSYARLLEVFWRNVDPVDDGGQFCDRGEQYRAAIFVADDEQRRLAEASRETAARAKRVPGSIATRIVDAGKFYPAEDEHQDFYRKHSFKYEFYRLRCGRDARLKEVWGAGEPTG